MTNILITQSPPSSSDMDKLIAAHTDVTGAELVEVLVSSNSTGFVVHINVNGICLLRVCRAKDVSLSDNRTSLLRG